MRTRNLEDIVIGHIARNQELCKLIESKGVELADVRAIDLHFWADDESAAHQLAKALQDRGYTVAFNPTEDDDTWSVEAQVHASVLEIIDVAMIQELAELAMSKNSEYDGWGTSIDG